MLQKSQNRVETVTRAQSPFHKQIISNSDRKNANTGINVFWFSLILHDSFTLFLIIVHDSS